MGKKKLKFINVWVELESGEKIQISDLPRKDYDRFLNDICRMKETSFEMAQEHLKKQKI